MGGWCVYQTSYILEGWDKELYIFLRKGFYALNVQVFVNDYKQYYGYRIQMLEDHMIQVVFVSYIYMQNCRK